MILVVGSGIAGMAAARTLIRSGHSVTVIDKGRGAGGRLSARRYGNTSFDHGAQYATARTAAFREWLVSLEGAGRAAKWSPEGKPEEQTWWTGTPRMSQMVRHPDLDGADIRPSLQLLGVAGEPGRWTARVQNFAESCEEDLGPFDAILYSVPVDQLFPLLPQGVGEDFEAAKQATYDPCWTVMADFAADIPYEADVLRGASDMIGWAAREATKPSRPEGARWLLQASPDWSRDHLEEEKADVIPAVLEAFAAILGHPLPEPLHTDAHRWRYARVKTAVQQPCLQDGSGTLLAAGDWCLGPRVEAAFESGLAAAERLIRTRD